ncbi:MAG: sigma-70 family RNA polymerase sigma factor [Gemmataceae bacterium]
MANDQLRAFLQRLGRALNPEGSSDVSDAQLLERFVNRRDEAAFEMLVWRYGSLVLNVCGRLLRHPEDAEDAFQAAFLALTRRAGSIGKGEALGSWLYKVAYRMALRVRAARHKARQDNGLDLLASRSTGGAVEPDVQSVLDEEINRLPEKYRAALILCYLQGKTTAEAARQLGCARGTICSRLAWARQRLRGRLTRRGLGLSVAGLVAELAPGKTPAALVGATVKAALSFASGQASRDALSGPVIALVEGVLRTMVLTKVKMAVGGLLVLSVLGLGTGLCTQHVLAKKLGVEEEPFLVRGSDGVRLPTDMLAKLGIQTAVVKSRVMARPRVLEFPGSLAIDPNRLTRVRCRFAPAEVVEIGKSEGVDENRELHAGDKVRKGQMLVRLSSIEVGYKKNDLFDALVQYELDQKSYDNMKKISSVIPLDLLDTQWSKVQSDRNAINRARSTLLAWGIAEEEIDAVGEEAKDAPKRKGKPETEAERAKRLRRWSRVELKTPNDGVIIERSVSLHEIVEDNGRSLFQIAQLDRLKVLAQVPEDDLPLLNALEPEQRRWTIRPKAGSPVLPGRIEEVGSLIDSNQHTAVATGFIDNPEGQLRPGQSITARVDLSPPAGELVLPAGAVVEEGRQALVFVQPDAKKFFYEQRRVAVVRRSQDVVHVRSRLTAAQERQGFQTVRPGESVVTAGAVGLKAILEDLKAGTER